VGSDVKSVATPWGIMLKTEISGEKIQKWNTQFKIEKKERSNNRFLVEEINRRIIIAGV
jgi:hypothetical protein